LRFNLLENWDIRYADDVNPLGDNIYTNEKCIETLIDDSEGVGVEVNVKKTKYMLLSRHQNVGKNHDIKIGNRSLENVA
jgi:hypothetical protein